MARRRRAQVTVAELLVRSAAAHDRYQLEDTLVLPRARHREKPKALRSLAKVRVFSVVAGALALTGGVATAVSMPVERSAGAVWPPAGLEPLAVTLTPPRVDTVVPPAKATPPESVTPPADSGGISPAVAHSGSNSGKSAKPGKINNPGKKTAPKKVTPVRHEIPDVPTWSRGRSAAPDRQAARSGHHHDGGGHGHHHGGGGRHRR